MGIERLRVEQLRRRNAEHALKSAEKREDPTRPHRFVVFRLTEDICAKCGKPRAEHPSVTDRLRT